MIKLCLYLFTENNFLNNLNLDIVMIKKILLNKTTLRYLNLYVM